MSEHNSSLNHSSGIDIRRIIQKKPITSLALVAVFSLIVGLGLVVQSDQMLTSSSRAASGSNGPQCPVGSVPLFYKTGSFDSSNMYPGTTVVSSKGKWKIATRRGVIVAEAGSGKNTINLSFASPIILDKVLIYDNDHNPPWTLNGYSLPKTANNQWFPAPYDFPNKTPTTSLVFNSNGDSPHFNVCIPGNPPSIVNSPTPTIPSTSPSLPPTTATPMPISCAGMTAVVQGTQLYLTVTPNNPGSGYYFKIVKDRFTVFNDTFSNASSGVAVINNPTAGKYIGYVTRTLGGQLVTSTACEYTYVVATPTQPPVPTVNTSVPRCIYAEPDEKVPAGGKTVYVNVLAENANIMKLTNVSTGAVIGTYQYNNMGSTPNEIRTFIRPDHIYRVDVMRQSSSGYVTGNYCTFGGTSTGLTPTGEPLPPSSTF